jgi:hypothetical protein
MALDKFYPCWYYWPVGQELSLSGSRTHERLLRQDRLATRSIVSRHVARVLIAEPEQWADWTVYEVLNRIPYVSRARISRFCAKTGLNPLRLGSELSPGQRLLLAASHGFREGVRMISRSSGVSMPPEMPDTAPVERSAPLPASAPGAPSSREGTGARENGSRSGSFLQRLIAKHFGSEMAYGDLAIQQINAAMEALS